MNSVSYLMSLPSFCGKSHSSILHGSLSALEAATLQRLAIDDSLGVWYSGMLSLAQGVSGVHGKRYAWSTVKLYYAAYYFLRAILLSGGWCQFYVQGRPRAIEARPGAMPLKQMGTSHESCYRLFEDVVPKSTLISQPIGVCSASEWLKKNRELMNYNSSRFPDPEAPEWFEEHAEAGVRKMLIGYFSDPFHYAFIDRHAMVAYPLAAGIEAVQALRSRGMRPGHAEASGFAAYWRDGAGQLPGVDRFFS